jgi:hypothetical protein
MIVRYGAEKHRTVWNRDWGYSGVIFIEGTTNTFGVELGRQLRVRGFVRNFGEVSSFYRMRLCCLHEVA